MTMSKETEFSHFGGHESPMVIQMLLEEVRQTRSSQAEYQQESREEFRRIHDKIDTLGRDVRKEMQEHDRVIVKLTTEASVAGRIAGFVAGSISSVLVYGVITVVQWVLESKLLG